MHGTNVSRTFDQLKKLFDQNVVFGNHNELVMRDLIESIFQYGGLRLSVQNFIPNPGQLIDDSYSCVNQFLSEGPSSSDVTPNVSDGTIKILRPGVYLINISLSFSGSANSEWQGSLFKNSTDMEVCTFKELLRPAGEIGNAEGFDPLVVEANDVLEYRVKANAMNTAFLLESGQFNVFRIG